MRTSCREHWASYGRNYYSRHDYEEVDADAANRLMKFLRDKLPNLKGEKAGALAVATADDFSYHDPVDGSDTANQGIRIMFEDGSRMIYRLSGTGTAGATLRVYIEQYEAKVLGLETQAALSDLIGFARGPCRHCGAHGPHGTDCDHLICLIQIPARRFPLASRLLKAGSMLRLFHGMRRGYFSACLRAARKHVLHWRPARAMCITASFPASGLASVTGCGRKGLTTPRNLFDVSKLLIDPYATAIDRSFTWHPDLAVKGTETSRYCAEVHRLGAAAARTAFALQGAAFHL